MQDTVHEPTTMHSTEATEHNEATEFLKDEAPLAGAPSPIPLRASRFQHATVSFLLPGRGLTSILIAGVIASSLSVSLTILIIYYLRLGKHQKWSLWKRTSAIT